MTKTQLEAILKSADISKIIAKYTKGMCPNCGKSIAIKNETGIFHCFACGIGGDVFKYLMIAKKISF